MNTVNFMPITNFRCHMIKEPKAPKNLQSKSIEGTRAKSASDLRNNVGYNTRCRQAHCTWYARTRRGGRSAHFITIAAMASKARMDEAAMINLA
jgi:hypothetical protein